VWRPTPGFLLRVARASGFVDGDSEDAASLRSTNRLRRDSSVVRAIHPPHVVAINSPEPRGCVLDHRRESVSEMNLTRHVGWWEQQRETFVGGGWGRDEVATAACDRPRARGDANDSLSRRGRGGTLEPTSLLSLVENACVVGERASRAPSAWFRPTQCRSASRVASCSEFRIPNRVNFGGSSEVARVLSCGRGCDDSSRAPSALPSVRYRRGGCELVSVVGRGAFASDDAVRRQSPSFRATNREHPR